MNIKKSVFFTAGIFLSLILASAIFIPGYNTYATYATSGSGTESSPLVVNTFNELKTAVENGDATYIKINAMNDDVALSGTGSAYYLDVNRDINIILEGNNAITDISHGANQNYLDSIFRVSNGKTLTISGKGSLKFSPNRSNAINAIVRNEGGTVNIKGGTLEGSYNTETYSRAIYQSSGELFIYDGTLIGANATSLSDTFAGTYITGGRFWVGKGEFGFKNNGSATSCYSFYSALAAGNTNDSIINGGSFTGFYSKNNDFSAYLVGGDKKLVNNSNTFINASKRTVDESFRVVTLVSEINAAVHTPSTGAQPDFSRPIPNNDGYYVTNVIWLDGDNAGFGAFQAGKAYTVRLNILAYEYYFLRSDLAGVINYNYAEVKNVSADGKTAVVEYTFPNTANLITNIDATFKSANADDGIILAGDEARFFNFENTGFTGIVTNWYKEDGDVFTGNFVKGDKYIAVIRLTPKTGYTFGTVEEMSVTVNGQKAVFMQRVSGSDDMLYKVTLTCSGTTNVTITYDLGIGSPIGSSFQPESIKPGSYVLPYTTLLHTPDGYQFASWSINGVTKQPGEEVTILADTTIVALFNQYAGSLNFTVDPFFADESPMEVNVTTQEEYFDVRIVSWVDGTPEKFVAGEQYKAVIRFTPKEGYVFIQTIADGKPAPQFIPLTCNGSSDKMWFSSFVPNENFDYVEYTYTATAVQNKATVTYFSNNAYSQEQVIKALLDTNHILLDPTKDFTFEPETHYEFSHWAIGSANGETKNPGDSILVNEDVEIYAVWQEVLCDHAEMIHNEGFAATCEEDGESEYYYCPTCEKYFEDADATILIGDETAYNAWKLGKGKISATGHTYGDVLDSWSNDQVTLTVTCSCGHSEQITQTGAYQKVTDATCTEKETGKYVLTIEDGIFAGTYKSSSVEIGQPLGHKLTDVNGKSPTCTEDGYKEAYYCSDCNKYFTDPSGEHEIGNLEAYNAWKLGEGKLSARHIVNKVSGVEPTKEKSGYKDAYMCSECGQYFEDEACTILIGDETAYNTWKANRGYLPQLPIERLNGGAIAGIAVGSFAGLCLIAYVVMFFIWKKTEKAPKFLVPSYKWINKKIFKK